MATLKYTLLTDGSSDKTLLHIIEWLLNDLYPQLSCEKSFADFGCLPNPPGLGDVSERIRYAQHYYPFDILFYHRDAEMNNEDRIEIRKNEVFGKINASITHRIVCIVPIKMMETWLLIDKDAIKKAAGNRNCKTVLDLPSVNKLESISDPKQKLHKLLEAASELKGRRLRSLNTHPKVHLVAEYITDFNPLRQLKAFNEFEKDLKAAIDQILKSTTLN